MYVVRVFSHCCGTAFSIVAAERSKLYSLNAETFAINVCIWNSTCLVSYFEWNYMRTNMASSRKDNLPGLPQACNYLVTGLTRSIVWVSSLLWIYIYELTQQFLAISLSPVFFICKKAARVSEKSRSKWRVWEICGVSKGKVSRDFPRSVQKIVTAKLRSCFGCCLTWKKIVAFFQSTNHEKRRHFLDIVDYLLSFLWALC